MKYLALKRLNVGWDVFQGAVLEDPDNADRLVHMGYIVPVPDDYSGEVSVNPNPTEKVAASAEPDGPSYADLQARAKELGISASGKKADLAAAIADKEASAVPEEPTGTQEQDPSAAPSAEGPAQTPEGGGSEQDKGGGTSTPSGDTTEATTK